MYSDHLLEREHDGSQGQREHMELEKVKGSPLDRETRAVSTHGQGARRIRTASQTRQVPDDA